MDRACLLAVTASAGALSYRHTSRHEAEMIAFVWAVQFGERSH
jgi:hypothetical protein